jgi:hypothetical protein
MAGPPVVSPRNTPRRDGSRIGCQARETSEIVDLPLSILQISRVRSLRVTRLATWERKQGGKLHILQIKIQSQTPSSLSEKKLD